MACHQQKVLNLIRFFRRHSSLLIECERTTVCGADNMILVLQLAMAEVNKKNGREFSVSLSDLLLVWKYLLKDKLGLHRDAEEVPESYASVKEMYNLFLKNSSTLDLIDLHEKCRTLEDYSEPDSLSSDQLLEFIAGRHPEETETTLMPVFTPSKNNLDSLKVNETLKRIFCGYLNLLVNSKNDIALAQVLNCPDRGLGREAFTDLKRKSRQNQMSLFLVATSFIRTLELGGKGYAPSESDPLRKHVKGLTHFVHFIDKLNEILGETKDTRTAGEMILSTIKTHLIKGRGSGDPLSEAAADVAQDLDLRIKNLINFSYEDGNGNTTGISPARPRIHAINRGTASIDRETIKMLLLLLDEEAACLPSKNKAELLCADEDSTLMGAFSLVTLFRSPEQCSGLSPKPLSQRIQKCTKESKPKLKQNLIKSQFSCTYKDGNPMQIKPGDFPSMSQVPTCVHPAPKIVPVLCFDEDTNDVRVERRGLQSVSGNINVSDTDVKRKGKASKSTKRKKVDMNRENRNDRDNEPPGKKSMSQLTSTKPKDSSKQTSRISSKTTTKNKLIAGQAKLTTFFRL
ncbi:PCNA-interacting partner [Pelobates fuscus]|uniref:PCNA-interacting partner n=1 Tax=Pelobates fuscus TaxID=191477 RepID=UPI002FE4BEA4